MLACATPWQGKEGFGCNEILPLEAICIVGRGEENHIERTSFDKILPLLLAQIYRSDEPSGMLNAVRICSEVANRVKLYSLSCNMEDEAAMVSSKAMLAEEQ